MDSTGVAPQASGMKQRRPIKKKQRIPLKLEAWRKFRNMTQQRLADVSEVSQGLVSQLEANTTDYTGETLAKLAFALNCEPADLIMRDPTDPEAPWSIWETLKPPEKRIGIELLRGLKRASGE